MSDTSPPVDYDAVAAELGWFGAKLRNTLALADEIRRIGSIRKAGEQAQARLDALNQQHGATVAAHAAETTAHEKTIRDLQQQITAHEQDLASRRQAADKEIAAKQATAKQIETDANAQADQIVAQGRSDAAKIVSDANASVAAVNDAVASKQAELADAQATLEGLHSQQAEIRQDIARLRAKYA